MQNKANTFNNERTAHVRDGFPLNPLSIENKIESTSAEFRPSFNSSTHSTHELSISEYESCLFNKLYFTAQNTSQSSGIDNAYFNEDYVHIKSSWQHLCCPVSPLQLEEIDLLGFVSFQHKSVLETR